MNTFDLIRNGVDRNILIYDANAQQNKLSLRLFSLLKVVARRNSIKIDRFILDQEKIVLYLDAIMSNKEILYQELMHLNERYTNAFSVMKENKITEARLALFWERVRPLERELSYEFRRIDND